MAAIAPWFRLLLPSCGPGFESQAHHLRLFPIYIVEIESVGNCYSNEERTKINEEEAGIGPY